MFRAAAEAVASFWRAKRAGARSTDGRWLLAASDPNSRPSSPSATNAGAPSSQVARTPVATVVAAAAHADARSITCL
jgi:hypothetical protein